MDEWREIETAERPLRSDDDHVDILLWDGIRQAVGHWADTSYWDEKLVSEKGNRKTYERVRMIDGYWHVEGDFRSPTHWKPLGPNPTAKA